MLVIKLNVMVKEQKKSIPIIITTMNVNALGCTFKIYLNSINISLCIIPKVHAKSQRKKPPKEFIVILLCCVFCYIKEQVYIADKKV